MPATERLYAIRRWMLGTFVPEFLWPRTVDVDGVPIRLRNAPYSFGTKWILRKGTYEKPERQLLHQIIRPGMQVLELGGSIGIVTSVLAKLVGPSGRVVSVEASASLTEHSRTWLHSPGRVDIVTGYAFPVWSLPAGMRVGTLEKECSLGGVVPFSIDQSGPAAATSAAPIASDNTEVFDLSSLCARFDLRPDALVADVEGSEAVMISQPPSLPGSIRFVCIELHPHQYPNGDKDQQAIVDALVREGFRVAGRVHASWLFER
ncbi:MAG TPA: hypothetical protein VHC70_00595 [Phycisphaerales bacterium]|jgi:FkbM family methyltransferase|nr:hypothetical protein [Phycisphaerales bacterium]